MPLLDKQTALTECRQRFEEVIIEHLAEDDEDEDDTREACGQLIDDMNEELLKIVDEIFSRANPH